MASKVKEPAVAYKRAPNPLHKAVVRRTAAPVVPLYQWSRYQKIEAIREGVSKEELENLKLETALDYDTLARILTVSKATLFNRKGKERFDVALSERIFLLADLYSYGFSVFENRETFNAFMRTPVAALGAKAPLDMIDTVYGLEEVKHLLGRIEWGVYS